MGIDYNSLPASSDCSDKFSCRRENSSGTKVEVPVNKILWTYYGLPALTRSNYSDSSSKYIKGTQHYFNDSWDITDSLPEFYDNQHTGEFIMRGSHPKFSNSGEFGPGTYTLKKSGNSFILTDSGGSTRKTISSGSDGVLPDRIIVVMSGGGGGGGASSGGE